MTPEARRIAVFSRGTSRGFRGLTPVGGHWPPSSGVGARLEWKKEKKNHRNKKASDVIKSIIKHSTRVWTVGVWWPWKVLSRTTSRHHCSMTRSIERRPIVSRVVEL